MKLDYLQHGLIPILLLILSANFAVPTCARADVADTPSLDRQLVAAGKASDLEAVKNLLTAGANVNAIDDGYTALDGAAAYGNFTLCSYLLHLGADPNLTGADRPIPLALAVESNNLDVIKLLLTSGAKIDSASSTGETALMHAVVNDNHNIVQFLLSRKASPNIANSQGQTALFMAAYVGDPTIIAQLVAHGAKLDAVTKDNYTALNVAAERGHASAVRALIFAGAMVNDVPQQGDSALAAGVRSGSTDTFYALLKSGAIVNKADDSGNTPLIIAANLATSPKRLAILMALVNHGANVNAANINGQTPLMAAAAAESPESVTYLRQHKADVEAIDSFNQTALMYAAAGRKSSITLSRRPLYSDPDVSGALADRLQHATVVSLTAKAHNLDTVSAALFIACSNGTAGAADALLASGISANLVSDEIWYPLLSPLSRIHDVVDHKLTGMTPLMYAACHNHADIIRILVDNKANIGAVDAAGRTALIHAAMCGSLNAVRELVKRGADVNARDIDGRTALFSVVQSGAAGALNKRMEGQADDSNLRAADQIDAAIVTTLLAAHADPKMATTDGNTPAKEADNLKRPEIAAALTHGSID